MGEVVPFRRRTAPARPRPTVSEVRVSDPGLYADLTVMARNGVAHRIDRDMTATMRAGIDAYHDAVSRAGGVRRIGSAVSWTVCGVHGTGEAPRPDTAVCLRCCPWFL